MHEHFERAHCESPESQPKVPSKAEILLCAVGRSKLDAEDMACTDELCEGVNKASKTWLRTEVLHTDLEVSPLPEEIRIR
jgi:hypothetical protein